MIKHKKITVAEFIEALAKEPQGNFVAIFDSLGNMHTPRLSRMFLDNQRDFRQANTTTIIACVDKE